MAAAALRCSVLTGLFGKFGGRWTWFAASPALVCLNARACDEDVGTSNQSEGDSPPLHKAKKAKSAT